MGTSTPLFWSSADGGKFVQFLSGGAPFVFNLKPLETVENPVITSTPVISGTGVVGSAITVTDATYTSGSPAVIGRAWEVDGVEVSESASFTFPGPAGAKVRMRNVVVNDAGGSAVSAYSNEITSIADSGAVAFPAQLAASSWSVIEDARTPAVCVSFRPGTGFSLDTVNFDYYFVCRIDATKPADITTSTKITSAVADTPRTGNRDAGTLIYSTLWIKRKSDGEERNATVGNVTKTQTLSGTSGTVVFAAIPVMPDPGQAESLGKAKSYYNYAGSRMQNAFHSRVCLYNALMAYRGNVSAVTWTKDQIKRWCNIGTGEGVQYDAGYFAQWDLLTSAVAYIALRTPAVLSQLTAAEQAFLPMAIETGLYSGAILMHDDNPHKDVTLRGKYADYASINPNIASGSPALVHIAMMHFGPAACVSKLWAFDATNWRTTLLANKNAAGNAIMREAEDSYQFYEHVGDYPATATPHQNSAIMSWFGDSPKKFMMRKLDMATQTQASILTEWNLIFGGNASNGEDNVGSTSQPTVILPAVKWHVGKAPDGSSPPAYEFATVKVPHRDTSLGRRGGFQNVTDANYADVCAGTPFFNQRGCIKEMNGMDGNGQRSTCSYSINSLHIWQCYMACLMVATKEAEAHFNWWDWRDDAVIEKLERARRGCVHLRFLSSAPIVAGVAMGPYLNCAKPNSPNPTNSETWGPSQLGSKFAFNATFSFTFDTIFKWLRDSDILPDLPSTPPLNLAQWEAPVNLSYT